jgi:hypothetical protein
VTLHHQDRTLSPATPDLLPGDNPQAGPHSANIAKRFSALALRGNCRLIHCIFAFVGEAGIDNHGALTICLHAGGNPATVKTGFALRGGGCSVDSLNQKSSSLPQPSLGSGGAGGLHSALSAGQAIWT